jgi:hypothetical protein
MDMHEKPRAERRHADQPSTLRGDGNGSEPQDSWVHDVSSTGMRIECRAELEVGDEVTVGLAGAGATRARIVWRRGNEYGCAFNEPLSDENAERAFNGAPVVRLQNFARAKAQLQTEDRTAELLQLIDGQPARGRMWMAGLCVAMVAVAAPLSLLLAR